MSIVLWPRQEVLQLVIPQLGSVGRHLNANTANNLIRRLTKLQSPDGKISFDRWLIVAKEVLRWNDHCIHLFWDMVSLSTYYLSRDSSLTINREDVSLDLEYVAIFLVLHLHDGTTPSGGSNNHSNHSKTPVSPTVAYEDVWPTAPGSPTDPDTTSPPTSPSKDSRMHRKTSPMAGAPMMSPRSPKANSSSPSHKRAMAAAMTASGSRTPRSHAQYLHSVRQKIPLILRSLSMDQQDESTLTDLTLSIDTPGNIRNNGSEGNNGGSVPYSSINPTVDFAIAKKTVDALGLIVCGGYSRDQAVPHLSSLFPVLNGSEDAMRQGKEAFVDTEALPTIAFSELSAWINVHMSMNDTLYPVSVSPSYGAIPCSPTTRDMPHISAMSATDADAVGKDSPSNAREKAQQPSRTVNTVTSLSRSKPTIINGCSTTVIHVIGGLTTTKSSFRKYRSMSFERTDSNHSGHDLRAASNSNMREHTLSDSDSDKTSPLGPTRQRGDTNHSDTSYDDVHNLFDDSARHTEDIEMWMRNNNNYLSKPETMLPPLYLNLCTRAKMYLISPYHSATITGCSDCEIVVGAVFGALIVSNCERVKITAACRKLLILNCLDCAFNVATLTTTIIAGDCRSLVVGPHNTSYRNLRNHLKLAALEPLLSSEDPSANPTIPAALCAAAASVEHVHGKELHRTLSQQVNGKGDSASPNCWASLCDVSSCLEAATTSGSPAGYAIDAMDDACPLLPPLPSTARLLPYENFRAVAIPFKAEAIPFDQSPIRTPLEYVDSLRQYRESVSHIKAQVASALVSAPATPASSTGVPPAPVSAAAASTLSPEERKRKQIVASTAVSKKFMEWLVSTGNAKQVLDLIRIDGEKTSINNQNNNH